MDIPLHQIDYQALEEDLYRIIENSKDMKSFLETILLFNDTYFYPASIFSLLILDGNGQAKSVHNLKTYAKILPIMKTMI